MKSLYLILSILPKNLISYIIGVLVRLELPRFLAEPWHNFFIKSFGLNMKEAEHSPEKYKSIEAIFTRKLAKGLRKIGAEPYVSPCDSVLTCNEAVSTQEKTFTIKGLQYTPSELTGEKNTTCFWISVFYLAPHDYHRVHAPINGTLEWVKHIPGKLWPVKPAFLKFLPDLFNKNERLVFKINAEFGGTVYLIMVGALNVGRMTTPFSEKIITNNSHFSKTKKVDFTPSVPFVKGEDIGTFMMGSTVILLFDNRALNGLEKHPSQQKNNLAIKVGEALL